jgi:hypothetical protein
MRSPLSSTERASTRGGRRIVPFRCHSSRTYAPSIAALIASTLASSLWQGAAIEANAKIAMAFRAESVWSCALSTVVIFPPYVFEANSVCTDGNVHAVASQASLATSAYTAPVSPRVDLQGMLRKRHSLSKAAIARSCSPSIGMRSSTYCSRLRASHRVVVRSVEHSSKISRTHTGLGSGKRASIKIARPAILIYRET